MRGRGVEGKTRIRERDHNIKIIFLHFHPSYLANTPRPLAVKINATTHSLLFMLILGVYKHQVVKQAIKRQGKKQYSTFLPTPATSYIAQQLEDGKLQ